MPESLLTVDDLVRAGACRAGVEAIARRVNPFPTALSVDAALAICTNDEERGFVLVAAQRYGDGYGYGYGNGAGYGDGDWDGI